MQSRFGILLLFVASGLYGVAQQDQPPTTQNVNVVQGVLIAPGSAPFHLKAEITEDGDASPKAEVEMFWLSPERWRRTIRSEYFSQALIVNGDKVSEQDSNSYFPLGLWSMVTATVDPRPILAALGPADQVRTKANGLSSESGVSCFDPNRRMCMAGPWGLDEFVGGAGHSVEFSDYHKFHDLRIARRLVYMVSAGDYMTLRVTKLEDLEQPGEDMFTVSQPTDPAQRIRVARLDQASLVDLAVEKPEIIWPQVLDGAVTGKSSFYIAIDREGKVREVEPLSITSERSNDSAIRQIMRWKFKPPTQDGMAAQVEGVLTFDFNTRAWGPKNVLDDAEVCKLVSNMVEPVVPPGLVPSGSVYKIWIAVDSDGIIIEQITKDGPGALVGPCGKALGQWHFSPIYENGQPRPYRALVEFHIG